MAASSPFTVWFNKSFSSAFNAIETVKDADTDGAFRILCSHTSDDFPAFRISDAFEVEPRGPSESAYLDYCEAIIRRHQVKVFVPGKMLRSIVKHRDRFERQGVAIVAAADAAVLRLLENKANFYNAVPAGLTPIPDYRVVNDLSGFDDAVCWLRERGHRVCFKPAVSVFGLGFRIITEHGSSLDRLLNGEPLKIGLEETRQLLAQAPRFRDLMVMQYLPGPERSVDCLAHDGRLIACVVRRKPTGVEGGQWIEENPRIESLARGLAEQFRLSGIFNVQFRDDAGTPFLLEINPRMSGGLHYACLSGVAFPYWAIRLALGTARPDDVPRPRTGIRVGQVNKAIVL